MASLPLLLFKGIPDDRQVTLLRSEHKAGAEEQDLLIHGLMQVGEIEAACPGPIHSIWFNSPVSDVRLPKPPIFAVNCVADPDRSRKALAAMAEFVRQLGIQVLNPPERVLASDRVTVAETLAGLDGLILPKTARVTPAAPRDVFAAAEAAGIGFPFLVRNTASHGGQLVRLDGIKDEERLFELSWGGRDIYITAYTDFSSADELYRKYRLMIFGEDIILRHVIIGEDYLLRMEKRLGTEAVYQEEKAAIESFDTKLGLELHERVMAIRERLGLDMFGIDCALTDGGDMVLFEANAAMNFFYNPSPGDIWDRPVERARAALKALLSDPSGWFALR